MAAQAMILLLKSPFPDDRPPNRLSIIGKRHLHYLSIISTDFLQIFRLSSTSRNKENLS
jgi:hypothetical protein